MTETQPEPQVSPVSLGRVAAHLRQICAEGRPTWQQILDWFELEYPRLAERVTVQQLAQLVPATMHGNPWQVEAELAAARDQAPEPERFRHLIARRPRQ